MVVAAGQTGGPGLGVASGAGAEVIGVEFVEAGTRQSQFDGRGTGADLAGADTVEEMTDEGRRQSLGQLWFFISAKITEEGGFIALKLETAGAGRASPTCRLQAFRRRSDCVPAEPYPPLKQPRRLPQFVQLAIGPPPYAGFDRTPVHV